jgi:hypothetical protein
MAIDDARRLRDPDAVERELAPPTTAEQAADRPKSGVGGFGATAAAYFAVAVALALIFVLVIVVVSR